MVARARREFLRSAVAASCCALMPGHGVLGQSRSARGRIDVHHHLSRAIRRAAFLKGTGRFSRLGDSYPKLAVHAGRDASAEAPRSLRSTTDARRRSLETGALNFLYSLPVHDSTVVSEIPFSLTAALLVGFLANAALFSPFPELSISRLDGGILLFFFALFMLYVYKVSREKGAADNEEGSELHVSRALVYIVGGIVGLYLGGGWVVDGAIGIAQGLGVDDALIGLTIIAVGTSSPELVASAVAANRNQSDIAVGNVVGSNIFNLLWVLGLTSSLVELPFEVISNTDLVMVISSSALILVALAISRNNTIMRSHGVVFVSLYVAYLLYVIGR